MDVFTIALLPHKTGQQEQESMLQPDDHTASLNGEPLLPGSKML